MNLVINSQYRPFSFEEILKPAMLYKEAYEKTEADYAKLAEQTEMWKDIANREKSPEAYAMYERYHTDLNNMYDNLSRGMNINNRTALLGLRAKYAQEILPIANASKRKDELVAEQRKIAAQDPTRLWENDASDMSIDTLIKNPQADYGRQYSGATLTAQVAAASQALAKKYIDNPKDLETLVGGDYYEYIKHRGFTPEAVLAAIQNSKKASPILNSIVNQVIQASGINKWSNADSVLPQARQYALNGLWQAIGQDDSQIINNWRAQSNLDYAHRKALQNEQYKPVAIKDDDGTTIGYYNPRLGMAVNVDGSIQSSQVNNPKYNRKGETHYGNDFANINTEWLKQVGDSQGHTVQSYNIKNIKELPSGAKVEGMIIQDKTYDKKTGKNIIGWKFGREGNAHNSPSNYKLIQTITPSTRNTGIPEIRQVTAKGIMRGGVSQQNVGDNLNSSPYNTDDIALDGNGNFVFTENNTKNIKLVTKSELYNLPRPILEQLRKYEEKGLNPYLYTMPKAKLNDAPSYIVVTAK